MAILLQVVCFTFFLGMIYGWDYSNFDEPFPSTYFYRPFNNYWPSLPTFDDFDEIMATMQQNFQQMSAGLSSLSTANVGYVDEAKKKLDAVEPVCTTKINSPTTTSIENNRRKQFRTTQTTTCVKELVTNGTKYMYTKIKVTDDKGIIISKSDQYQSFSVNTSDNITSSNDTFDNTTFLTNTINSTTFPINIINSTTFPINTVDDIIFSKINK